MKKTIAALSFILITHIAGAQRGKERVDSLLDYYSQTLRYNGVAFVSVKGRTMLSKGYGYKDRYRNRKNDPQTVFQIGSMTKQFTAEIILMLAKEQKLGLQDKLSRYFPGYPSGDEITIENLLTHTSGIRNYTEDTLWQKHPASVVSHEQMMAQFRDKPLAFAPGAKFQYSNSNYILLTYIIEQLTGKPYTVVARERILSPLGMSHSGFDFTHLQSPDKPVGYNCVLIDSFYTESMVDSTQSLGAGALYSTAEDLYKWHQALQSYQLLDKEWQQKAYVPFKGGYGYGWFIKDSVAGQKLYVHSGRINGFSSYFIRIEKEDICIVLLTNVAFGGQDMNLIARNIVRCLYDESFSVPAVRKEIILAPEIMKRYEGDYVLQADTSISLTCTLKGNSMLLTATNQPQDRIYPQTQTLFFSKAADAQFEFMKDDKRGYKLVVHQNGHDFEAIRRM